MNVGITLLEEGGCCLLLSARLLHPSKLGRFSLTSEMEIVCRKEANGIFNGKKERRRSEVHGLSVENLKASWERVSLIPGLPNDIAELCVARVPRVDLTKLRLVCKSWKYLIESREFYNMRAKVQAAESWLYVLVEKPSNTSFKAFSPRYNKWYALPPIPSLVQTSLWQGFACVALESKLLLMGGMHFEAAAGECSSGVVSGDVYIFSASENKWSRGTSMNTARSWFAATVIGDFVYVAGGQGKDRFLNSVEVYDLKQDLWSYVSSMLLVRSSCYGLTLHGKFWVIGGEVVRNQYGVKLERGSSEVYDPSTGAWTFVPEMWLDTEKVPGPNTVHCGKLLTIHQSKLMIYEDASNSWCHVGYLPGEDIYSNTFSRFGFALESIDDDLYVAGGMRISWQHRHSVQSLNTLEVCKLSSQGQLNGTHWRSVASMGDCEGNVLASAVMKF